MSKYSGTLIPVIVPVVPTELVDAWFGGSYGFISGCFLKADGGQSWKGLFIINFYIAHVAVATLGGLKLYN